MNDKSRHPTIVSEEFVEHPMEAVFDIEPGTTSVVTEHLVPTTLVKHGSYDDKDNEIEQQFQEVYDLAIEAFYEQTGRLATAQPNLVSRNMEVANAFLTTALTAIKEKSALKANKDKLSVSVKQTATNITNNTILMDRNALLREFAGFTSSVSDGQIIDVTPDDNEDHSSDNEGSPEG